MKKNLESYLDLDYTVELKRNSDSTWFAKIAELPGCITEGDTADQALKMIRDAQRAWLKSALADRTPIPEPHPQKENLSGRFLVRVPRSLHDALVAQARRENVSLNQFVNVTLSRALPLLPVRTALPARRKSTTRR